MEGRYCEDCGVYISESHFGVACCVLKTKQLDEILKAWEAMTEADRQYGESTQAKANAVGAAVRFDEIMKGLWNDLNSRK